MKPKVDEITDDNLENDDRSLKDSSNGPNVVQLPFPETSSRMRSVVWKYFSKIPVMNETCDKFNDNTMHRVRCGLCSAIFVSHNTTGNLIKHLRNKHEKELRSLEGGDYESLFNVSAILSSMNHYKTYFINEFALTSAIGEV